MTYTVGPRRLDIIDLTGYLFLQHIPIVTVLSIQLYNTRPQPRWEAGRRLVFRRRCALHLARAAPGGAAHGRRGLRRGLAALRPCARSGVGRVSQRALLGLLRRASLREVPRYGRCSKSFEVRQIRCCARRRATRFRSCRVTERNACKSSAIGRRPPHAGVHTLYMISAKRSCQFRQCGRSTPRPDTRRCCCAHRGLA